MNSSFKARNTIMNPNQSFHNLLRLISQEEEEDAFSLNFSQPNSLNPPFPTSTEFVYPQTLYAPHYFPALAAQWYLSGIINYLQNLLSFENPIITPIVFNRVFPCLFELITHAFGHRLFKKLVASCDEIQLKLIVKELTSSPHAFLSACENIYGSFSLMRLIKVLKGSRMTDYIVNLLNLSFFRLMTHDIGSTVILPLLLNIPGAWKHHVLYMSTIEYALELAIDKRGSISLRKVIENVQEPFKDIILELVSSNALWLVKEIPGSSVVEHVLTVGHPNYGKKLCSIFQGRFVEMSMLKPSSFLVVTCLKSLGMDYVIADFLACPELWQVARHEFGKFAVQAALIVTKERNNLLYQQLVEKLQQHIHLMNNTYIL